MKPFNNLALILLISAFASFSQAPTDGVLATANGQNYTIKDLDPETREGFEGLNKNLITERTEALGEQIAQKLFKAEALSRKLTVDKLLEAELPPRIPNPTEMEIKAVYDANKESIGNATLAEIRPKIIDFLRRESYPKALFKYVGELKLKHQVVMGKDVNAPTLLSTDVLATVNGQPILVKDFEEQAGQHLYELKANVYEKTQNYLKLIIFSQLTRIEAQKLNLAPEDLIAREISDKLREFTDEERDALESAFRSKLTEKYQVNFYLKEPIPFVQKISADDDPAQGSPTAPVTVIMFSDFQCPACSATHPVLKKVLAEYPSDKIRFVVRDFPLVQIHNNAFKAAQAANAAYAQGKFFEYIELLYNHQDSLDTTSLKKFAAEIGLNQKQFDADLDSGKFAVEVNKDMIEGDTYGVNSTPTIFVNGVKVRNLSAQAFRQAIEWALKK